MNLGRKEKIAFLIFSIFMITSPIVVRFTEKVGIEIGARFIAYLGFTWMGLLLLFLSLSVVIDTGRLILYLSRKTAGVNNKNFRFSQRNVLALQLITVLIIYLYGLFEAETIQGKRIIIASPKIGQEYGAVRIAMISDVHLGLLVREGRLRKILKKVEENKPDILVSTGDLVDGQLDNISEAAKMLERIKPPMGKFAILGNHEFYAGLENSISFTKQAGFTLLRNKAIQLGPLNIVGVDDEVILSIKKNYSKISKMVRTAIKSLPSENFTVLLKHRPNQFISDQNVFDLQLSGHTHKGQIFPFNLVTWLFFPYRAGRLVNLESGTLLYLSPGSGTWGPPIRFLARPEVTIIDLVHGD